MKAGLLIAIVAVVAARADGGWVAGAFPDRLERYLTDAVKLNAGQQRTLLAGGPITTLLDGDASREVGVFGAVWIDAPVGRYVDAVTDIESFERGGGFQITRRISDPPRLEDFSELRLPDEDVKDLRSCRLDDCEVKLGAEGLARFREQVDWRASTAGADASRLMQQLLFEYATRYQRGGNAQLATYRDSSRPTFVAQEFATMVAAMPELTTYMPDTRRYLLDYPQTTLAGSSDFLYWQITEFGLKPTIRVSHVTIHEARDATIVTSKMIYASHYFWTGLELRVLVPDPSRGTGFWFVTVNRSRSDGLSGFTGYFVRRRVRSEVEKGAMAGLRSTKRRLEAMQ